MGGIRVKIDNEKDNLILFETYNKTGNLNIRDKIVENNLKLVSLISSKMLNGLSSKVSRDDIYSYGLVGLFDAIERFDIKKNIKFSTYASIRIRGEIYDQLRKLDPLSRYYRTYKNKIDNISEQYLQDTNKEISIEKLAKKLDINITKLINIFEILNRSTKSISIDANFSKYHDRFETITLKESITCDGSLTPESIVENENVTTIVNGIISEFKNNEKKVLILYYYEGLSLNEIGEVLGVSESRVCQMLKKIKKEFQLKLKDKGITKEFFNK